jgi:hypothetical protein
VIAEEDLSRIITKKTLSAKKKSKEKVVIVIVKPIQIASPKNHAKNSVQQANDLVVEDLSSDDASVYEENKMEEQQAKHSEDIKVANDGSSGGKA